MDDFVTLEELKGLGEKYRGPATGVYCADGEVYRVRIEFLSVPKVENSGRRLVGTVPLTTDALDFFQSKNWKGIENI